MLTRTRTTAQLRDLGLVEGDLVMVHASMRTVGPVLGGPDVVIQALVDAVGESGTVAAYVDWEHAAQAYRGNSLPRVPFEELLAELPPFNPATARAARSHGVLPEFLRTWPGAVRSGNPGASVAAIGARAAWLCAEHPLRYGYGPGSPFAKLVEAEGKVLLLGAPLGTVSFLHHSEHVARLPEKRVIRYREPILGGSADTGLAGGREDAVIRWVEIEEFDTSRPVIAAAPEEFFTHLVEEYVATRRSARGTVGRAPSHLFDAADLHAFAVAWMEDRWGEDAAT